MNTLANRISFFYDNAGFNYDPHKGETEEQGHNRCALSLAIAEMRAKTLGWDVRLEDEYEPWDGDCEPPVYLFCVCIYDASGAFLDSLGMVGVDSIHDPYLIVVAAELYSGALNRLDKHADELSTQQANELSERATYAAGSQS